MMNTSLQNIITRQNTSLHDSELKLLFQGKDYPCFQLADFYKNAELMKKEQFLFFLRLLEKWNEEAQRHAETLTDCAFTKNQFIFSWLKSAAVLNQKHIDGSLSQLFSWYNSTRGSEPQCFIKKEPVNKCHLEQWEIRNSYKSNLPLEIDTYKRRLLLQHTETDHRSPLPRTAHHSPSLDQENSPMKIYQQENSLLRGEREQQEIRSYLNNYRKGKVCFYKNMAKNYYRNQFQRDKLATSTGFFQKRKQHFLSTDEVKSYRIKTTTGARPFGANNSLNKTAYTNSSSCFDKDRTFFAQEDELRLPPANINGMGLICNPFEVKLRKKKK